MADLQSTQIPIGSIVVTVLGAVIAAGGTVFGFLFRDRVKASEAERDRAIMEREKERAEKEEFKTLWKRSVDSHRSTRRDLESVEIGHPSVPPPAPSEDTGSYRINAAADEAWQAAKEEDRRRQREEILLRRYNADEPLDTPPEGFRARQKSHHGKR